MIRNSLKLLCFAGLVVMGACASVPETPKAQYQAGKEAKERGNMQNALNYFENTVELDPGHREAQLELVSMHIEENEPDHAVAHLTKLIEYIKDMNHSSPSANLYARRARIFYQVGNYEKALLDTNRVLELNPEDTEAYNIMGLVFLATGDFENAQGIFRTSLAQEKNPEAYLGLAKIQIRRKDWESAENHLNQAVSINPDLAQAYKYRAVAYRELQRINRMRKDLRTYLILKNPEVPEQKIREELEQIVNQYRKQLEG